ncbi:MAG: protein kinase [Candidatus Riflebacteria bacterium]|nr:protein kinase [Candidatus Riflebacteria bacterium]
MSRLLEPDLLERAVADGLLTPDQVRESHDRSSADPGSVLVGLLTRGLLTLDGLRRLCLAVLPRPSSGAGEEGRWVPIAFLGAGGAAEVLLFRDEWRDDFLAVKFPDAVPGDTGEWERFLREPRALARLHHPNIVMMFDVRTIGGRLALLMEFVPGGSLRQRLGRPGAASPLPLLDAVRTLDETLVGLHAAHRHRIVHRDIKPENILLTAPPVQQAKITDFGIARFLASQTRTMNIAGTIHYMAPEALDGEATVRCDLYSVGVLAFELVTGRRPFAGSTFPELSRNIVAGDHPRPGAVCPTLPPRLEAFIEKAMARRADDRFGSADEMARALNEAWGPETTLAARSAESGRAGGGSLAPPPAAPAVDDAPGDRIPLRSADDAGAAPPETPLEARPVALDEPTLLRLAARLQRLSGLGGLARFSHLERSGGRPTLFFEPPGGEPLSRWLAGARSRQLPSLLMVSGSIVRTLDRLWKAGEVHGTLSIESIDVAADESAVLVDWEEIHIESSRVHPTIDEERREAAAVLYQLASRLDPRRLDPLPAITPEVAGYPPEADEAIRALWTDGSAGSWARVAAALGRFDGQTDWVAHLVEAAHRLDGQERFDQAVELLRQMFALLPGEARLHAALGEIYEKHGHTDWALGELETARELDPEAPEVALGLARVHQHAGRAQLVLDLVSPLVAHARHSLEARRLRGLALGALGRKSEAIADLEAVVKAGAGRAIGRILKKWKRECEGG